jgi:hypothetical protein
MTFCIKFITSINSLDKRPWYNRDIKVISMEYYDQVDMVKVTSMCGENVTRPTYSKHTELEKQQKCLIDTPIPPRELGYNSHNEP